MDSSFRRSNPGRMSINRIGLAFLVAIIGGIGVRADDASRAGEVQKARTVTW